MNASSDSNSTLRSSGGKRRFLAGAGGAALALALFLPSAASAADYTAATEAELRQAILDANADGDPSSTITLTGNIAIAASLPNSTKPLVINTGAFSTNGMALTGIVTVVGAVNGNDDTLTGSGQTGLRLITFGGLPTTVTNNATVTGGDGTNNSTDGLGAEIQHNGNLINNGSITGGSSGGPGSLNGGFGLQMTGTASVVNNGLIQGGTGIGVTGGRGAFVGVNPSALQTFTNNATGVVRGGEGTGGALGGVGIFVNLIRTPIINQGLIEGGNGAAAIVSRPETNIINSGIIRAGAGGTVAIDATLSPLTLLELRAGSSITGLVLANAGGAFAQTLQLGGTVNASFDMSSVGATAQYRNFNRFVKAGTSSWTLTGNASTMPGSVWELQQGTLVFDGSATGQTGSMLGNGALVFQQDGALSVGSLNGAISVLQSGPGTTTLVGNNHSLGTTITGGKLSIDAENALGTGALTITGGALQWTGNGAIARSINWGASGAEIEVAGTGLTLDQPLLGGGALTKSGSGALILNGANSYTGGTTISAGTLRLNGSILGNVLNNGTLMFGNSAAYTYAGLVTGSGDVSVVGTGLLTLTGNSNFGGTLTVSNAVGGLNITGGAAVSWGGATTHSNGQLLVNAGARATSAGITTITNSSATPTTLTVDGAGSTFSAHTINAAAALSRNVTVSVTNGGRLTTTVGDLNIRAATVSAASTNTGQLIIDGAGSLADLAGGLVIANSNITNGKLTISGGGTLRTAGSSSVGFPTGNIRGVPSLRITGTGSNWTSTGMLGVSNGDFTLDQGGTASFTSATFGMASAVLQAKLTVSGAGSRFSTTGGDLTIGFGSGMGELVLSDGGAVDLAGLLVLANSGTASGILSIGGAEGQATAAAGSFTAPSVMLGSATSRINFNHTGTDTLFGAAIFGAGAINHVAGDTNLTGNSAGLSGATTVSGGTLRVNGTLGNATSIVTVQSGGRLGGSGTIGGNVTVTNGVLAPGNSPGTLTIAGNLTLNATSLLDLEFGQSNVVGGPLNDLIEVGGNLTLDGTVDVTVTPGGSFDVGVYRIISYAGSLTDNGLAIGTTPGGIVSVQTSVAKQVNLVNFAGADVNFWDGTGARGDGTITGGSGVWQASGGNDNWTVADGSVNSPYPNNAFAVFMAAPGTVTVDTSLGAVNASGMQFASNGYTLTGGAIGLTGTQSVIRVGDGTALGVGFTATIASDLTGAGDLVKTDLGTLVLTGANNFAGEAIVKVGGLRLADGGTLTSLNTIIAPDAGERAVLTVTGSNGGGSASTWTTGGMTVGYNGNGTLNVTNGGRVVSASGAIGYDAGDTGTALISGADSAWQNGGRITVGLFGTGTLRIENGAQVSSNDGIIGGSAQGNAVISGPGSSWTNTTQFTVGSFGAGTLRIENGASVTSNQGYIGANADGSVTVTGAGSNWLVSDFNLTIGNQGNGTLTIENGGRVQALGDVVLGQAAGTNGTLTLQGTAANRGVLETGRISAGVGTVNVTLDGGLLRATWSQSDFFSDFGARDLTLGANGGVIDTNGYDIGIAPRFVGTGGLAKHGAGRLTLTGNNSYAGATDVLAGTLLINGNQSAATGLTSVAAAATLGGFGTIGGSVDMSAGGMLTPGSGGVGTLTINGNLVLGGGSQLAFEFGQANVAGGALNDLVNVGGNLTLDGTLNVTVPAGGSFGIGLYRVLNYGGTLIDNGLTLGSLPAGANAFVQTAVAGQVNLINTGGATLNYWDGAAGPKFDNVINGGSGIWQSSAGNNNWTDASGAVNAGFADNAVAIFSATAGTVTVDGALGAVRAGGMQFANDGYVVTGDSITLTGAEAAIRVGDGTAVGAGYTATIASTLTGASQLIKMDSGTLVLTGANSYAGGTRIDGGTVQIGNGGATGSITGDIVSNAALVVNRTGTLTLDGAISGSGTLTQLGGGTLILTGTNSYAGGTTIGGGTVQISSDANLGDVAGTLSLQGGTLRAAASFTSGRTILLGSASSNRIDTQGFDVTLNGAIGNGPGNQAGNFLDKLGSGTLTLTGANSYANRTVIAGGILALAGAGTLGAGNLVVAPGTVFDISQTNSGARIVQLNSGPAGTIALGSKVLTLGLTASFSDWSGTITDGGIGGGTGGRVVITAPGGAVRFFQANSYTGGTTIASGTLELNGNGSLYAGGALTINAGLFNITGLAGTGTTIGDLSGAGSVWLGAKSLTLGTSNDSTSFATISGTGGSLVKAGTGTFVFAGGATHTGGTTIAAGTLQLGDGSLFGSIAGDILNNGTLAFNRAGEQAFNGVISGTGAVNQIGGGTTILTGANSYAGVTTVSNGTLRINGNQSAATGLTRVLNGGTLGGAGTIGGSVTVADGGTLAPGNSPGTLTIAGNLALSAGSRLAFEFGQANLPGGALNDLINIGGNLTLDGKIDVTESAGGSFGPGVFRIINYAGVLTDNGLTVGTMPAGSQAFVQTVVPGQVNLVNTAGLTLGFWDGAPGPKNDGAIQGGTGIWRVSGGENNWTTATGAINADYAQDSFAIFTGSGATVTIDNGNGNVRAAGMQFAVNGYTLTGGSLELTGTDARVRVGDGSAGEAAITATIASALSGSARLVKDMGGTLVLSGTNSYTGGTALNGGTIRIASDANLGAAAGGLSFNGGTLHTTASFVSNRAVDLIGNGTFHTDAATTLKANGAVSGAGMLIKDGAGRLLLTAASTHTGGTTIAAGSLELGASGSFTGNVANDGLLLVSRTDALALAGMISGSGAFRQTGSGITTLSGANGYTGATDVLAGTLLINGNQSAATGLVTVSTGATLGGAGTIGGSVTVADGGRLAPGNSPGTLTINGNLALSGGSQLAFEFGAANAVGSPLNDLVNVGGNLTLDGTLNVAVPTGGSFGIGLYRILSYGGTLTDNGLAIGTMPAGAEVFVQTSVAGQVNLVNTGSAVLNFWDGNAGPKFNGAVDGGSGTWLAATDDSWSDITGAVNAPYDNGAFAIFAGTAGTVTIDDAQGAVTASGLQFATSGYTITGDALTLTGPQSVIRVGDGSAASAGYTATIAAALTGNTQLVKTDLGTLILTGANGYSGGTAINGGTIQIANDGNLGAAAGGVSLNGGTLRTTADMSSARTVALAGQGAFSTDSGTTLSLTGGISGAGLLTKTGGGTLVLAGTGTYTGGTDVTQGTLLVNGNYAATTGRVNVAAAAALGGTGTIGGDVNLAGTLAPGAGGAGTLTINGNLTIAASATLAYEFGQANVAGGGLNDLVNVGGNLTLDGTINVTVPAGGAFSAGIYRVFNYGGTLTNNGLTLGAMPAGSNVGVQTSIAGQVNLVNFAGLSLSFWDGAAGPKNNGVVNGGTGIWQHSSGNDNWTDAAGLVNAGYSNGAFAVFAGTAGTVTVDNGLGQVAAGGMQFAVNGYTVTGGGVALTGGQATIRVGDGSTAGAGYTATINAALSGASELVKTDAGTLVLGGTNSYTGGTRITGGTVQIANDANLGAAAGGVTLDGGTLATSATLSSARAVNLLGAGTLSTANGTVFTLSGTLSGAGALDKAGGGTLLLTGNNGGYTGATRVSAGTLAVTGAFGGAVDVRTGARLEGTGSVGAVTNAGTVSPGRDGFGTLTVNGSYTGANGILAIDAELGGDTSRADRLVVNGATAGNTVINVTNQGGLGAATVNGIKIIDVTGASNGVFTLGNGNYQFEGAPALIAGAYGYRLYKNGVTTPADGDWYLRSSLLQAPEIPLYQPGVPVYESYGQTLAALNQLGTMQERVGNRQWAAGNAEAFGIWGRSESVRSRPQAVRSTSFADANIDSWKVELGADKVLSERGDGASLVLGVLGSYGEANASIASPFGNGSIKTRGYSAGATLSWYGPQGFYVDGRAQMTWFDSKLSSTVLGKLVDSNKGTGQAYSIEVGKRAPIGGNLSVTPQIQTIYATAGFDRFTDPNGAAVSSKLGDSLKTRWGISLDRHAERSHLYGVLNLSYEWLDGTVTEVSGTAIARENHRMWGELGLGGSLKLGGRLTLYSEVSADTAINDFGKSYTLKGVAGLRMAF